ncbi:hypothetical protein PSPO01_03715 [Paraphaeosphaeria sporulosa]
MNSRYQLDDWGRTDYPKILSVVKGMNGKIDSEWTEFLIIKYTKENIDKFITDKKAQIDQNLSPEEIEKQKTNLDALASELGEENGGDMLKTSINLDLYRNYVPNPHDPAADERLIRNGFDDENIVHRNIQTIETNEIIEAALGRFGQKLERPEEFLGPRRIKKVYITRDETSVTQSDSEIDVDSPQHYESDVDSDVDMTEDGDSDFHGSPGSVTNDPGPNEDSASFSKAPQDYGMLFELEAIP